MSDSNQGRNVTPESVVVAANFKLRRSIIAPDASPFLSHHNLEEGQKERVLSAIRTFSRNDIENFDKLFRMGSLVCCWVIATTVAESYGHDGDTRIYDHILHAIGCASASSHERQKLNQAFRKACLRYGLSVVQRMNDGNDSFVDDYIVQAGVSHNQLPHLALAFLRAETELGQPPLEDTIQLSLWAQEAVQHFISTNLPRPRRVIEHDDIGYHAAVFARIISSGAASTPFEQAFHRAIVEAKHNYRMQGTAIAPRLPTLVFSNGELSIENPNASVPIVIAIGGRDRTLTSGSRFGLSTPWLASVTFRSPDGKPNSMEIIVQEEMLAFDPDSGRLLRRFKFNTSNVTIDALHTVLVSSQRFFAGGSESYSIGEKAHAQYITLETPVQIQD